MKIGFDPKIFKNFQKLNDFLANEIIEPVVLTYLESLSRDDKLGVAVSGGADSLALALWLYHAYPHLRSRIVWLHFNHRLRGDASDEEEAYVAQVAELLNVEIFLGAGEGAKRKKISEATLREERYIFIKKTASRENLKAIFLGHHADDVAETMLMRWMRGSGVAGLSSPKPIRYEGDLTYLRPFLKIEKSFLIDLLKKIQVPYAEDHTNELPLFFRNRVRHVLKDLKVVLPESAKWNVSYTRERLEEENEALEQILNEILIQNNLQKGMSAWHWGGLSKKPKNLQRRALHSFLEGLSIVLEARSFEYCLDHLMSGVNFSQNIHNGWLIFENKILKCTYYSIHKNPTWPLTPLTLKSSVVLPDGAELSLDKASNASLDSINQYPSTIFVRNRRPGDRYRLEGSTGSKKLSDIFINLKIECSIRDSLPVVCDHDGFILWVPGLRSQDLFQKKSLPLSALGLTYRMEMATMKP